MNGYDLKAQFSNSVNFFWPADLGKVYRELRKLEAEGLIVHECNHQSARSGKEIYSVTEEGKKEFVTWLRDFPRVLSGTSSNEFLVRIFFGSNLETDELMTVIERYLQEREEELRVYKQIDEGLDKKMREEGFDRDLFCRRLTVRKGLSIARTEIEWAVECLDELRALK